MAFLYGVQYLNVGIFASLLYIFALMRLFLVIRVNFGGVMRFFVGTIHGLRRILFDLVGAQAQ